MQKWTIKGIANPDRTFTDNLTIVGAISIFVIFIVKVEVRRDIDIDDIRFWILGGSCFLLTFLYLRTLKKTSVFELHDDKMIWTVDNSVVNSRQYSIAYESISQYYSYRVKSNTILIIKSNTLKKGQIRIVQNTWGKRSGDNIYKFEEFAGMLNEKLTENGIEILGKPTLIKGLELFSSYGELAAIAIGGIIGAIMLMLS